MKKQLLALGLIILSASSLKSQIIVDTVSVGAGYINHKFYSLENDEQGIQPKDNWDIAFEVNSISSSILANTQKPNFAVYKAPYSISNYGAVDTSGISTWPILYNSDSTWSIGAFNRGANPANSYDLGWGVYSDVTHFVTGDSCYVVKLSTTSYKKLKIVNLANGVYNLEYANINGSSSQTVTIAKSAYTGKNFAYLDMTSNTQLDREPVSSTWDLMFGRYTAFVQNGPAMSPYGVVGIMANKGVYVAQLNDMTNPSAFAVWPGAYLSPNITAIGHDWKTVNINTGQWAIAADTVYLVNDRLKNIWKVRCTGFGGSGNGNFIFSKEKISAVGIADEKGNAFGEMALYPNPASGNAVTLVLSSRVQSAEVSVSVMDVIGKVSSTEKINTTEGINQHQLNTEALSAGVYFVTVQAGSYVSTQKLIKQ
jgi:methionine-rich copper-binding protein CopC